MVGCCSHCFSGARRGIGTGDVPPSNLHMAHNHRRTGKEGEEQDEAVGWASGTQVELLGL